jgi:hydroxyacylglutathione hydrolase
MIVEQIWTANSYRNFNYLIACEETGCARRRSAGYRKCLAASQERGWTITQILNTHEHGDHIGGNKAASLQTTGACT